jgi:hypothetical protein
MMDNVYLSAERFFTAGFLAIKTPMLEVSKPHPPNVPNNPTAETYRYYSLPFCRGRHGRKRRSS